MALTAPLDTLDAAGVTGMIERLRELGGPVDETEAIDEIAALERLKSAAAAAQARVTAMLRDSRVDRETGAGVPAAQRGGGLAEEVGLARRESATLGSRHLGLATALVEELPRTLAHLADGTVGEWGATLLAKETAVLDGEDRRRVDRPGGGRPTTSPGRGRPAGGDPPPAGHDGLRQRTRARRAGRGRSARRGDERGQRSGTLRPAQPHQGAARVERSGRRGRPCARCRHRDADRSPVPEPGAARAGRATGSAAATTLRGAGGRRGGARLPSPARSRVHPVPPARSTGQATDLHVVQYLDAG